MKKVLLAALVSIFFAPFATAEVNVVSWGGAYTESQKLGYGDPYQEKSGVKINWIDYSGGLSEVRTQVESGNVTWDVVDVELSDALQGCDEGILEEIDHSTLPAAPDGSPAMQDFLPGALQDWAPGCIRRL